MPSILSIALSGLNDAVTRVANATSNIVNSSSTSKLPSSSSDPYTGFRPQDVVTLSNPNGGVTSKLVPHNPAFTAAPDPTSPFANAQGLIATPNVDLNADLIASKEAEVAYSADAKLIKISQEMDKSLLDAIG